MTLFVTRPERSYEISDAYLMIFTFCLFFAVGRITKHVIQKRQNVKKTASNVRGGSIEVEFSDNNELSLTILSCIADNERYLVKDPKLIKLIFNLVKAKVKDESLALTPNMMRFLALKLINNDKPLLVKIGDTLFSASNRARLLARLCVAGFFGSITSAVSVIFPHAILILLLSFDLTANCGYKCNDYFEHLPKEGPVRIYAETSDGNIAIVGNDDSQQMQIYTPSRFSDEVIIGSTSEHKIKKSYTPSRKKAKQIKFSEFKESDSVLSQFKNLEEPDIPQKRCSLNDVPEIID